MAQVERVKSAAPNTPGSGGGGLSMPMLRTEAVELIRVMRGFTRPLLTRTRDSGYYVVKFQSRARHSRSLVNELIAARLARLVGLPVPDHALVWVSEKLTHDNPLLTGRETTTGPDYNPGLHFGSAYVGTPGKALIVDWLPDSELRAVSNRRTAFWGGLVFDLWISNCDRREVVFSRRAGAKDPRYKAWLIDHDQCFAGENWSLPSDPLPCAYSSGCVYEGIQEMSSFETFLSRIEQLKPIEISECMEDIPEEWGGNRRRDARLLIRQLCTRQRWLRGALAMTIRTRPSLFRSWRTAA
jgi:HipA-like kinase